MKIWHIIVNYVLLIIILAAHKLAKYFHEQTYTMGFIVKVTTTMLFRGQPQ